MESRTYTRSEKTQRARLLIKGARQSYSDTSAIEKQIERIDQAAEDRYRREAAAHRRQLETAKDELAAAKVSERTATREEKAAAREIRKQAEKRLRMVERAAR